MADEILRSKHAFGSVSGIAAALEAGKIDHYDILFVKDDDGNAQVGWIDKDGKVVLVDRPTESEEVIRVDALPEFGEEGKIYIFNEDGYFWDGEKFVNLCKPTDVSNLESQITTLESELVKKVDAETVQAMIEEHSESMIEVVEF